jgi:hypothetical protein
MMMADVKCNMALSGIPRTVSILERGQRLHLFAKGNMNGKSFHRNVSHNFSMSRGGLKQL